MSETTKILVISDVHGRKRERDERVYRFSSIDEAIGVLSVVRRAW